jgi:hypothetical protein
VGHQAGVAQASQMRAHAVGVQREAHGELAGRGRAAELAQELEQPAPGRLGERIVVPVQLGEVNSGQFSHLIGKNRRSMIDCAGRPGMMRVGLRLATMRMKPWPSDRA